MTQLAGADDLDYAGGPLGDGFDAFYAVWYPKLLHLATCLEPAWAEEIAQETLARAYTHFDRLHQEMPGPWLRTVARNVARDLARFHARVETLPDAYENAMTDPYPGPEDIVIVEDARQRVRSALRDVSEVDRELLTMSSVDGVTTADLAAQLSATEGAVRVRLHRARRRLGKSYLAHGGNLVTAPVLALARLGRKIGRPVTPVAGSVAAGLAMAGAAVVVGALPPAAIAGPATTQAGHTLHAKARVTDVVSSAPRHARPARSAVTRTGSHAGATTTQPTTPRDVQQPAVKTQFSTTSDPSQPGEVFNADVLLTNVDGHDWDTGVDGHRSAGPSFVCYYAHITCSGGAS